MNKNENNKVKSEAEIKAEATANKFTAGVVITLALVMFAIAGTPSLPIFCLALITGAMVVRGTQDYPRKNKGMLADAIMPKEEVAADPIGIAAPLAVTAEDNLSPDEVWALSEEDDKESKDDLSKAFFEEKDWSVYDTPTFVRKGIELVENKKTVTKLVTEEVPTYAIKNTSHSIVQDAVMVEDEAIYFIENEEEHQNFFFDEAMLQHQH